MADLRSVRACPTPPLLSLHLHTSACAHEGCVLAPESEHSLDLQNVPLVFLSAPWLVAPGATPGGRSACASRTYTPLPRARGSFAALATTEDSLISRVLVLQWFCQVDLNGSGAIDAKELQKALGLGYLHFSLQVCATMIRCAALRSRQSSTYRSPQTHMHGPLLMSSSTLKACGRHATKAMLLLARWLGRRTQRFRITVWPASQAA
jgi:hypothetical protein